MTTLQQHKNEHPYWQQYLNMVTELYGTEASFDSYFTDAKNQSDPTSPTAKKQDRFVITAHENNVLVGHIIIMIDERSAANCAWFGFFECKNHAVFIELWNACKLLFIEHNIYTLYGPINSSIWCNYRFIKTNTKVVPMCTGELLCKPEYYTWWQTLASNEHSYYSAMRTDFSQLVADTKPAYNSALEKITFSKTTNITKELMAQIFTIARNTFTASWNYVELSNEELLHIYADEKQSNIQGVYTMRKQGEFIGFALCFQESKHTINVKTMAIKPEYQGKGLGLALLHYIHANVPSSCNRMLYTLIRTKNQVSRLPQTDAEVFRTYGAFTINLH